MNKKANLHAKFISRFISKLSTLFALLWAQSRLKLSAVLILASGLLAACGPDTQTLYIPPTDLIGQQCVQQCRQDYQVCELRNELEYKDCLADEYRDELYYERYRRHRAYTGKGDRRYYRPRGYYPSPGLTCSRYSRFSCSRNYDRCFQSCGGVIDTRIIDPDAQSSGAPKLQVVTPPVRNNTVLNEDIGECL